MIRKGFSHSSVCWRFGVGLLVNSARDPNSKTPLEGEEGKGDPKTNSEIPFNSDYKIRDPVGIPIRLPEA